MGQAQENAEEAQDQAHVDASDHHRAQNDHRAQDDLGQNDHHRAQDDPNDHLHQAAIAKHLNMPKFHVFSSAHDQPQSSTWIKRISKSQFIYLLFFYNIIKQI